MADRDAVRMARTGAVSLRGTLGPRGGGGRRRRRRLAVAARSVRPGGDRRGGRGRAGGDRGSCARRMDACPAARPGHGDGREGPAAARRTGGTAAARRQGGRAAARRRRTGSAARGAGDARAATRRSAARARVAQACARAAGARRPPFDRTRPGRGRARAPSPPRIAAPRRAHLAARLTSGRRSRPAPARVVAPANTHRATRPLITASDRLDTPRIYGDDH